MNIEVVDSYLATLHFSISFKTTIYMQSMGGQTITSLVLRRVISTANIISKRIQFILMCAEDCNSSTCK